MEIIIRQRFQNQDQQHQMFQRMDRAVALLKKAGWHSTLVVTHVSHNSAYGTILGTPPETDTQLKK